MLRDRNEKPQPREKALMCSVRRLLHLISQSELLSDLLCCAPQWRADSSVKAGWQKTTFNYTLYVEMHLNLLIWDRVK